MEAKFCGGKDPSTILEAPEPSGSQEETIPSICTQYKNTSFMVEEQDDPDSSGKDEPSKTNASDSDTSGGEQTFYDSVSSPGSIDSRLTTTGNNSTQGSDSDTIDTTSLQDSYSRTRELRKRLVIQTIKMFEKKCQKEDRIRRAKKPIAKSDRKLRSSAHANDTTQSSDGHP